MLRLTLVNSFRSCLAPRLLNNSCSLHPNFKPISNFSSAPRTFLRPSPQNQSNNRIIRKYSRGERSDGETTRTDVRQGPTLKERLMAPPTENAYGMGKGAVAGAAAIGLGALCYYGFGLSKEASIHHNSMFWSQTVRERIQTTYAYFGGACIITALASAYVFHNPRLLELTTRNGWMSTLVTFGLMIGTGAMAQGIPYSPGFGLKQIAWLTHCAVLGAVVAPLCFLGGPILTRAALYTGGVAGGLSAIAVCAPSDKFLYLSGPLAIGLGLVMASSLAGMWLPPTTVIGAGLASMNLYGGLLLFSGFLLYDTQRVIRLAEIYPEGRQDVVYDPINASIAIYMDVLNIFIRIALIMGGAGGNNSKRR